MASRRSLKKRYYQHRRHELPDDAIVEYVTLGPQERCDLCGQLVGGLGECPNCYDDCWEPWYEPPNWTDQFLPCPFCGGTNIEIMYCDPLCCGGEPREVTCACGAAMTGEWSTANDVLIAWNTRTR